MNLEELRELVKVEAQENSVIIFRVPDDKIKAIGETIGYFNAEFFSSHGIRAIACPMDIEIVVVPCGGSIGKSAERKDKDSCADSPFKFFKDE
jgi:hypothetical protein